MNSFHTREIGTHSFALALEETAERAELVPAATNANNQHSSGQKAGMKRAFSSLSLSLSLSLSSLSFDIDNAHNSNQPVETTSPRPI